MTSVVPAATFNLKLPSKSVTVPFDVPFSITVAPMTPSPRSSTTVPVIIPVCAYINVHATRANRLIRIRLVCFIFFPFLLVSTKIMLQKYEQRGKEK